MLLSSRYRRLYSKKSHNYRVQTLKVAKDYSYIPELQRCILKRRMDGGALPRKSKSRPSDPRHLGNLAGVAPHPTAELVQTASERTGMSFTYIPQFISDQFQIRCVIMDSFIFCSDKRVKTMMLL